MTQSAAPAPSKDDAILDAGLVAEAHATMRDKFPRIIAFFMEDSETYIRQIEEGLAAGNAELMIPPAHTLKSSARQMGACKLSNIAKAIEAQAKETLKSNMSAASLAHHMAPLREAFTATRQAFKEKDFTRYP